VRIRFVDPQSGWIVGERIWLGDEHRRRYLIDVTHVDRRELRGSVVEERIGPAPSAPRLVIGQSILKNERMDWAIQKATELGADVIVPLVSEQTVVRPKEGRVNAGNESRSNPRSSPSGGMFRRWAFP
jgi:16S rRNA (uracil1498-N3)-methyltransferase